MKLRRSLPLLASVLVLSPPVSTQSLNLFKIQPISDFPTGCASAYNVEITDCIPTEITKTGSITKNGNGICSLQCINALNTVNSNLSKACAGVRASPNTLIGLFFLGNGVSYLCPNSVDGNGPAPSSTGAAAQSSSPYSSSLSPSSSSSSPSSSSSTSSTSELPTSTTHTTLTISSTSTHSAPPSQTVQITTATPSFQPTTIANNGVATVLTSQADKTAAAKSNPDAYGGGGSPFEVAANGANSGKLRKSIPAVMAAAIFWWGLMVGMSVGGE